MIALLSADLASNERLWSDRISQVAFAASALVLVLGVTLLANHFFGWPPLLASHEERRAEREKREHEALMAGYARRDAFQELLDELHSNTRDVGNELVNERTFGAILPGTAWSKNRHVLRDHAEARELVRDAYQRTHRINQQTIERYRVAGDDDVSDPAWLRLTEEETKERKEALEAIQKARAAVETAMGSLRGP
jgi:hypothetical protein